MLMGSIPEDYDIATDARPDDIINTFKRTVPIGVHYGVVLVMENDFEFEVATFRSDGTYSDGRHPDTVTFCDARGDALRRDFTINGMFYDPIEDKHFDYVGGEIDLKARLIRAIGDPFERFEEDRLRMIRAVRFACRFDFKIEDQTAEAIKKLHEKVLTVSMERIRDELRKTLTGPNPDTSIKVLDDLDLLHEILPEVTAMKGVDPGKNNLPGSWELAMAALLHDIGKPVTFEVSDRIRFNNHDSVGAKMAEKICERLRMSNAEKERITWLVKMHLYLRHAQEMRISKLKRLFAHEGYPELAELYKVDSLASTVNLDDYNFCQNMFEELKEEEIKPEPLITGNDLIALGLKPGPIFSKILDAIKDEQLEQKITTKEEALKKAKELAT
jgi:poly(A) polymerase